MKQISKETKKCYYVLCRELAVKDSLYCERHTREAKGGETHGEN